MPQLAIMFFYNHLQEPVQKPLTFVGSHVIDVLDVVANGKKTLPSSDGIGTNDWVDGPERATDVIGRPARLGVQVESLLSSYAR